ncbi:MAG: Na/Pi cotransporter family protein [Myxococcales bacterium]|nr:Na/Pi cotransporter family protein [Myxococcales bacterium]
MSILEILIAVAAAIILFLFGIEQFSKEVQAISGRRFRRFLARGTQNRFVGFTLGAMITAVIQSSTATSVITVGLVNAGVLSFRSSLGVLFGANVGTTVTAQLVALKLTDFAPTLLLVGFIAGYLPFRWRVLNRAIFYFGLVFFSLNMVSNAVAPLRSDPQLIAYLSSFDAPITGVIAGALFTAVVQSSSVTTGVVIILLEQDIVTFDAALPLVLGANIGTTVTALIASASLDTSARRTAISHALYNIGGALLFLPILRPFGALLRALGQPAALSLATAHLLFNMTVAVVFLIALRPFASLVERLVRDDVGEGPLPPAPQVHELTIEEALGVSSAWISGLIARQRGLYTAVTLALQTRDAKIRARARRLASIIRFGLEEAQELIYELSRRGLTPAQSQEVLRLVVTMDHIRQLMDSMDDLMRVDESLGRRGTRFSMDDLLDIQKVFPVTAKLLTILDDAARHPEGSAAELDHVEAQLSDALGECYLHFIERGQSDVTGTELADFLSIHQRLRSKSVALSSHLRESSTSTLPEPTAARPA